MKTIKEIPSLIGSLQSNKMLQKMQERQNNGEFRSQTEYNEALREQLVAITQSENEPTFTYIPITTGPAYSEYMNGAMDQIALDLEVAFSEINYVFAKIASHESFFDRTVREVMNLIKKLERQLESVEIEASLDTAFNKVHYDSFLNKSKRMSLEHPLSSELYFDDRESEKTSSSDFAEIDVRTGLLTLPKFSSDSVDIAEVSIIATETTVSDFDIQIPGITTANLLSTVPSDIWSYNILTRNRLQNPAVLALEIDLGDKKEVNQLLISPNAAIPALLDSITYEDQNGADLPLDIQPRTLSEDVMFSFPTVIARRFKLRLKQDRTKILPFDLNGQSTTLDDLQRDPTLEVSIDSITQNIQEQINDPSIKNSLGLQENTLQDQILLNNYVFSLNSIEIGLSDYKSKGVYVSNPVQGQKVSLIGLEAESSINEVIDIQSQLPMPSGSVEYSLVKKDYAEDGRLMRTSQFNMLPLGQNIIDNERLFFDKDKTLTLRFLAHKDDGDASGVKIYRNGEELILGVDWRFPDRQTPANPGDSNIELSAANTRVQILHTDEQILNGVYYAEYSPRYILQPDKSVIDKGVRYLDNGGVLHPLEYSGEQILFSDVFTKVIIRNHTDAGVSSPSVDFYRINMKEETDE